MKILGKAPVALLLGLFILYRPAPVRADASFLIVSGDHQSALSGTALSDPFAVRLVDSLGSPVAGATVQFEVVSGGGSISPSSIVTDFQGMATASATLGPGVGTQQFRASTTAVSALPILISAAAGSIGLETRVSALASPVFVGHAHDASNRMFIVEQRGLIRVVAPESTQFSTFLDVSGRVLCCGEQGLLGLAFHPQYASNGRLFVNYTRAGDGATVVAEYHVSGSDPNIADPSSERIILTFAQPFSNHNGGMIEFGPDGFLYIGTGDGGSGNDPDNHAQNINDLLGKILRIDVNQIPYASPVSNPFFGATPGRDEIFAFGLRNPWRFSFDRVAGMFYVADVGQSAREEVDLVTLGGNYGWRVLEGTSCTNLGPASCSTPGFIGPITEYGHDLGRCSITGGYAYRGLKRTLPDGAYVYGDFCTGEIFLYHNGTSRLLLDTSLNISSFGEDESGELYVVGLGGTVSRIALVSLNRVDPESSVVGSSTDITLSGTGFVSGLSVNAGTDIAVSNVQVVGPMTATATLTSSPGAIPGIRSVVVTSLGQTTGPVPFTLVPLAPTLETSSSSSAAPGSTVNLTLTGTNLYDPQIAVAGGDITVSDVSSTDPTSVTATFFVSPQAAPGPRVVTVMTAGGTSGGLTFTVLSAIPTLTAITPAVGARGTSVLVTLTGANLKAGATSVESMPGITPRNISVMDETTLTALFEIASGAATGIRNVRVTTPSGMSAPIDFDVVDPFPDLEISSSRNDRFGAGFDETYQITVLNSGTVSTTGSIFVSDTLPGGMSFVSATGVGWSCSHVGSEVSCVHQGVLGPGGSASFILTVAVDTSASPTVLHTIVATTAGDLDASNNTDSDETPVSAIPVPAVVLTPSTVAAGQQASLELTVDPVFPHQLSGTLQLSFTPGGAVGADDPSVQFQTGGRTVTFVIPANESQALFSGISQGAPLGFQTGTVAGQIQLSGTLTAGRIELSVTPAISQDALHISPARPVIQAANTTMTGGFAVLVSSFSTAQEITVLSLEFQSASRFHVSCGSVAGCSASGGTLSFDVSSLFSSWFSVNPEFGSLSLLRLPLAISGSLQGTVSVTLGNRHGLSNAVVFSLP